MFPNDTQMTELFNAKDAKKLSSLNDPNELLKTILGEIKECSLEGKYKYVTRSYGFGDGVLYDIELNYPNRIKEILRSLRDLGFNASVESTESQFVDIFLLVTW
jgi:hypothetical protein